MPMRPLPRTLLLLAYLFMSISASMSFLVPLQSFALLDWRVYIYIWAGTLVVGGLVGVLGTLLRSVAYELFAIPMLLTGYTVYVVILLARVVYLVTSAHRYVDLPGSIYAIFNVAAFCMLLIRRYVEMWLIFRAKPIPSEST